MRFSFNPNARLIVVRAHVSGPRGRGDLQLVLDTGASRTLISEQLLRIAGYDPHDAVAQGRMTTASGIRSVPVVIVQKLSALGCERVDLPVVCHTLPSSTAYDGLLGLDFFRGREIRIDFRNGQIELT